MKRAQYTERGPNPQASIEAVEFTLPELAAGQALVEVLAAPINPSDVLTLTGLYGMLPPLPAVGGNEGVGKVVALGPDTKGPPVGQTVLLPVGCGSWSTHIVAEAKALMPLPNDADPLQLAMMTVNPPTASLMLSEFVKLEPGEWVIQNVANSGVGSYLIQLAKARGFKTVNIVRRESAVAGVLETGGDVVLVDGPSLAKRVAEATGGAKIRLAIDAVGGSFNRQSGELFERRRRVGELRHDERRALPGVAGFVRVPRRDLTRLLAGAMVPQSQPGTTHGGVRRNRAIDRQRQIKIPHSSHVWHRSDQGSGRRGGRR